MSEVQLTTLCYLERGNEYLMLHRISKKNDINKDKWIGVGGHFEDLESPEECIRREVLEETGYEVGDLKHLITIPSHATLADNYAYVYVAKNCRRVSGQQLDDTEFLNVYRLSPEQIEELIRRGEFQQSVHVMAWLMASRDKEVEK